MNKKRELTKMEYLVLGMIVGVFVTPISVKFNYWLNTCISMDACNNTYLGVGFFGLIGFVIYILITNRYNFKLNVQKKSENNG